MVGGAPYGATKAAFSVSDPCVGSLISAPPVCASTESRPAPFYTPIQSDEITDEIGATTLLHRAARPEEIALVVGFLASPNASYVKGAVIAFCRLARNVTGFCRAQAAVAGLEPVASGHSVSAVLPTGTDRQLEIAEPLCMQIGDTVRAECYFNRNESHNDDWI